MLGYKCPKCGTVKFPDGKGCKCGASYSSLRVIKLKVSLKPEENKEYYGKKMKKLFTYSISIIINIR